MADLSTELCEDAIATFGFFAGRTAFANHLTDTEANAVILFVTDTGGPANREDSAYEELTCQVLVKGDGDSPANYSDAKDLAEKLYRRYHGLTNWDELPSFFVHWSKAMQKPYPLGRDENNREMFVFNILLRIREK